MHQSNNSERTGENSISGKPPLSAIFTSAYLNIRKVAIVRKDESSKIAESVLARSDVSEDYV